MRVPGPDHPIIITPHPKRVRVVAAGAVVADTSRALSLAEASYPPVAYIPREDIAMERLRLTEHHTTCSYKGEASYYSVTTESGTVENAAWSYEHPHRAVAAIRGHLAFYPTKVEQSDDA